MLNIYPNNYIDSKIVGGYKSIAYLCDENSDGWMDNSHTYESGIGGLLSQFDNAQGKVLIGGLGLGLLLLLLLTKKNVDHITVVELNPNTIANFHYQGYVYDKTKVSFVIGDIEKYKSQEKYDWCLLDHYNYETNVFYLMSKSIEKINSNIFCSNFDFFLWEQMICENNENVINVLKLPKYSKEKMESYIQNYKKNGDTLEVHRLMGILETYNNER